jgi:hydrogenase expression/formation protein HypD
MKYLAEYRDAPLVHAVMDEIVRTIHKPWVIMEICGGQTHSIMKYGLDQLLPTDLELVHGPGCPVCVTSLEMIDKALAIASLPDVIFTSYGDMLRVPGSGGDLFSIRAAGGDVRVVYSSLDAVKIAQENPDKQVVFFAIGFETTAPANAMSVIHARRLGLQNFSLLVSHVRVPPAMHAILGSPYHRVQGFLAAGHVCSVMGYWEYPPIAEKYKVPIVVTGFEPLDIEYEATKRFQVQSIQPSESPLCISGQILQGLKKPFDCPAFSTQCTPEHPLGATMVSSEGACAAYYRYGRSQ